MQMDEDVGHLLILNIFVVASGTLSCMCSMADWCCESDGIHSRTLTHAIYVF